MAPRTALLVAGVGRSGSSALTRVLNLLGAALPEALTGPGLANPRGHWEPARIVALNDEMLQALGGDWWDVRPIPPGWFGSAEAAGFAGRAAALIAGEYGAAPLLVLKDPRLCRLAPLYLEVLAWLDIAPCAVLPLRHPAEVAGSVVSRDGTDPAIAELIWVRHMLETEAATRRCRRVWVGYSALLADWRGVAARIEAASGVRWPNPPDSVAAAVGEALEPGLRHFDVSGQTEPPATGRLAAALWQAAGNGLADDEAALRAEFDAIRLVVEELDRLGASLTEAARQDRAALRKQAAALALRLQTAEAAAADLQAALAAAEAADGRRRVLLEAADADRLRWRARAEAADMQVADMTGSRSWRLTRPLRTMLRAGRTMLRTGRS